MPYDFQNIWKPIIASLISYKTYNVFQIILFYKKESMQAISDYCLCVCSKFRVKPLHVLRSVSNRLCLKVFLSLYCYIRVTSMCALYLSWTQGYSHKSKTTSSHALSCCLYRWGSYTYLNTWRPVIRGGEDRRQAETMQISRDIWDRGGLRYWVPNRIWIYCRRIRSRYRLRGMWSYIQGIAVLGQRLFAQEQLHGVGNCNTGMVAVHDGHSFCFPRSYLFHVWAESRKVEEVEEVGIEMSG